MLEKERRQARVNEELLRTELKTKRKDVTNIRNNDDKPRIKVDKEIMTDLSICFTNHDSLEDKDPFEILFEIDMKYLKDYLPLCSKTTFDKDDEKYFRILYNKLFKQKKVTMQPKNLNK